MSKNKKKRNKQYSGTDAAIKGPVVHHYTAVDRNKLEQWWFDHKRKVKTTAIVGGGAALIGWFIYEAINLAF